DSLAKNNSIGDQANGVSSNISVGSSVTSVNVDQDEVVEGLKVGLQEDGEGNVTGEVSFNVAVDYPPKNTTYSFDAKVVDSKTGTDRSSIGTVTVGDGTSESEKEGTKDNETSSTGDKTASDNESTDSTGITDSTDDTTTDSTTDESTNTGNQDQSSSESTGDTGTNRSETAENATKPEEAGAAQGPVVHRPETGVVKVNFGTVQKGHKVAFSVPDEAGLESVKVTPATTTNVTVTVESVPPYRVEGQPVFVAKRIDVETKVKQAHLTFEVNKTWIQNQAEEVVVKRLHSGNWGVLETERTSESNDTVTYRAETSGFSKFAVTTFKTATHQNNATQNQDSSTENTSVGSGGSLYLLAAMVAALLVAGVYFYRRRQ
ncbi:MAG: PGF-pre-PGF domain-containing protein, partial [Candidatus Nanohalobium sp.]